MAALRVVGFRRLLQNYTPLVRTMSSGNPGDGAGKGGGSGGSIRDAGGSFGKMEQAHEDQYFRQQQAEQLKNLKSSHEQEILHHEAEIRRHQDAIKRHKSQMDQLK